MLKKILNSRTPFERYFKEADDDNNDQVSVTVAPRKNRGTDYSDDSTSIKVAPHKNRGTDYDADDAEDNDVPDAEDDNEAPDADTNDEGTDYNAGDDNSDDNADNNDTADNTEDDNTGDDGPDTGDEGTDYASDDGADGDNDEENSEDTANNAESEEDKKEKQKKYNMYKRFLHLYESINRMIEKSRDIMKDDPIENVVIKTFSNNLTDIYDNMYDYMTLRFRDESYVQILVYFETVLSIIRLNFELLRNNHINLKQ